MVKKTKEETPKTDPLAEAQNQIASMRQQLLSRRTDREVLNSIENTMVNSLQVLAQSLNGIKDDIAQLKKGLADAVKDE